MNWLVQVNFNSSKWPSGWLMLDMKTVTSDLSKAWRFHHRGTALELAKEIGGHVVEEPRIR